MLENSDRKVTMGNYLPGTYKSPLKLDNVDACLVINNSGPTSNCQLSSIDNFNEIIDTLSVKELVKYINNIIYTRTLKMFIITNKYRNVKFLEAMEKSIKYKIHISQNIKVKNRNQYIYILKKK